MGCLAWIHDISVRRVDKPVFESPNMRRVSREGYDIVYLKLSDVAWQTSMFLAMSRHARLQMEISCSEWYLTFIDTSLILGIEQ